MRYAILACQHGPVSNRLHEYWNAPFTKLCGCSGCFCSRELVAIMTVTRHVNPCSTQHRNSCSGIDAFKAVWLLLQELLLLLLLLLQQLPQQPCFYCFFLAQPSCTTLLVCTTGQQSQLVSSAAAANTVPGCYVM